MNEKYTTRFELYIQEHYGTCNKFSKKAKISAPSLCKWINGTSFPSPKNIRKIWKLTKDEIGPMYWYMELPTEVKLRNESIKLLRSKRDSTIRARNKRNLLP